MDWHTIYRFVEDVRRIRNFLSELAAHEMQVATSGLGAVADRLEFAGVAPAFEGFSVNLIRSIKLGRYRDETLATALEHLRSDSKIDETLSTIGVEIEIARRRQAIQGRIPFVVVLSVALRKLFTARQDSAPFAANALHQMIATLSRLIGLLDQLQELELQRSSEDAETFKPSRVNVNVVAVHIDAALAVIAASGRISEPEKTRLTEYLQEAKAELAKEKPGWRNIVGALVIAATILSGVADVPDAVRNINSAIHAILGTAVEERLPELLPSPHADEEEAPDTSDEPAET